MVSQFCKLVEVSLAFTKFDCCAEHLLSNVTDTLVVITTLAIALAIITTVAFPKTAIIKSNSGGGCCWDGHRSTVICLPNYLLAVQIEERGGFDAKDGVIALPLLHDSGTVFYFPHPTQPCKVTV